MTAFSGPSSGPFGGDKTTFSALLPREYETDSNKAPVVRAVTALLMVIAILSTTTRLTTKLITVGSVKIDDHLVAAATFVAIVESVIVISGGAAGLGQFQNTLDSSQVSTILKFGYFASAMYILCVALTKVSATRTLLHMSPRKHGLAVRKHGLAIRAVEIVIGLWAMGSTVAILFQCGLQEPWDSTGNKCNHRAYVWVSINTLNILTDLAIVTVMVDIFRNIQTSRSKKILVIGVFGSRILTIPAIICHIIFFNRAAKSTDQTFDMWSPTVVMQVVVCLSIFTTCVPNLKPFLDSVESGQMHAGDLRQTKSKNSTNRSNPRTTRSAVARGGTAVALESQSSSCNSRYQKILELEEMEARISKQRGPSTSTTAAFEPGGAGWDGQSYTSQTVLVQQSWRVDVERSSAANVKTDGGALA